MEEETKDDVHIEYCGMARKCRCGSDMSLLRRILQTLQAQSMAEVALMTFSSRSVINAATCTRSSVQMRYTFTPVSRVFRLRDSRSNQAERCCLIQEVERSFFAYA